MIFKDLSVKSAKVRKYVYTIESGAPANYVMETVYAFMVDRKHNAETVRMRERRELGHRYACTIKERVFAKFARALKFANTILGNQLANYASLFSQSVKKDSEKRRYFFLCNIISLPCCN